jgi:quercetin dioxygenase-like cupin family protein
MSKDKQSKSKRRKKTAPVFAKRLSSLIEEQARRSKRGMASTAGVDPGAVHHLCTTGAGSDDTLCKLLKPMKLKRRRVLEILASRHAELCDGEAREMWRNFRYAFLNAHEYMAEICPLPLDKAYACSHAGVSIKRVVELARLVGIQKPEDVTKLTLAQANDLFHVVADEYGSNIAKILFSGSRRDGKVPKVLYVDTFQQLDAGEYLHLHKCRGKLLCGIPHVMVAFFEFEPTGRIGEHFHAGGVEFLYSQEGTFELIYRGAKYPRELTNDGSVILLEANRLHLVRHVAGQPARLLVVRYDPQRRSLPPGLTLKEREERKRKKRQNANKVE